MRTRQAAVVIGAARDGEAGASRPGDRRRAWIGRVGAAVAVVALGAGGLALAGTGGAATPAGAAARAAVTFGNPTWTQPIGDARGTDFVVYSSPNVAQLPGGPSVVVGDRAGHVYAYNLASGSPEWDYTTGAPVTSTPSVAPTTAGSGLDSVFVGTGNAAQPTAGGYQAISPGGGDQWFTQESNPSTDTAYPHNGVQASMAVGDLQSGTDVVAGSLGEEEYAMTAGSGAPLSGFPWYQADSEFSTPAIATLTGQTDIVEGGASSPGISYGETYNQGGHLRILRAAGNADQPQPNDGLVCQYTTDQDVYSSPAVGQFLGGSKAGIVFGTGTTFAGASQTDDVIAVDPGCHLQWTAKLDGSTKSSPALADVLGNGQLQVVEGTNAGSTTGTVYALNGQNGGVLWSTGVSAVIGSVVTADLGTGHQDVLAPTTHGVVVLTGTDGAIITTLQPDTAFQNSPLVTDDPNGTIGITLAGYQASGSFVYHYEIAGSNGAAVDEAGAWPEFHHDPSLSGDAGTTAAAQSVNVEVPCTAPSGTPSGYYLSAGDGGIFSYGNLPFCGSTGSLTLNAPVVGMAPTADAGGYWEVASDGGIFAFGNAQFYGSMGGKPLDKPIVGMAATPTGGGYWEVASDGGIFAFGNAQFHGSMGGQPLNAPVVGIAADGSGGYWEVASDGGIFAFGGAPFDGSMGGRPLNEPIVSMESVAGGAGYRFAAADGGVFSFGTAPFDGSMGGQPLNKPVVAMTGF